MTVNNELIGRLLADYKKPEDLIEENGLLKLLPQRLVERALEADMSEHLCQDKNKPVANARGNTRNGKSKKTLKANFESCPFASLETEMAASSLKSCPSTKLVGRVLMTRSSRYTH